MTKNNENAKKIATYEEKAPYSNTIKAILTLSVLALALIYFFAVFDPSFDSKEMPDNAFFIMNLVLTIGCFAMWSFFSMKFRITDTSVEAVMPPFRYQIKFFEIESVTTIDKIPWYVGWGLRLWGRGLAFVSIHKKAVVIDKKNGVFRRLILTTQNPDEFVRRLKKKIKN